MVEEGVAWVYVIFGSRDLSNISTTINTTTSYNINNQTTTITIQPFNNNINKNNNSKQSNRWHLDFGV